MKNVTIYTTPTCSYCQATKQFFKDNKIEYKEIDVSSNADESQKMIEKSGQMGVPVIMIEDGGKEELVVGFDVVRLSQLLGLS